MEMEAFVKQFAQSMSCTYSLVYSLYIHLSIFASQLNCPIIVRVTFTHAPS